MHCTCRLVECCYYLSQRASQGVKCNYFLDGWGKEVFDFSIIIPHCSQLFIIFFYSMDNLEASSNNSVIVIRSIAVPVPCNLFIATYSLQHVPDILLYIWLHLRLFDYAYLSVDSLDTLE